MELTWIAAARMGGQTVEILERGSYAVGGVEVSIAEPLAQSIAGTLDYPAEPELEPPDAPRGASTSVSVANEPTLAAARRQLEAGHSPLVLNFASAVNPGGRFLGGALAQEEYLARSSGLYACIRHQPFYTRHRELADDMYTDAALYSPGVPVIRGENGLELIADPYRCAMLTCAAPHASGVIGRDRTRRPEIEAALTRRIARVFAIGQAHGHDSLVLGAWGCGAFGNDGAQVARLFAERIAASGGAFARLDFAILDGSKTQRFITPFEAALG